MKGKKWKAGQRIGAALLAAAMLVTSIQPVQLWAAEVEDDELIENPDGSNDVPEEDGSTDDDVVVTPAEPIVSLDFNSVTGTGLTDAQYVDLTNEVTAKAVSDDGYKLEDQNTYLDLTGGKYLTLTMTDQYTKETSPLTGKDKITIIYDSYYMGEGQSWAFYADSDGSNPNSDAAGSVNLNYIGIAEGNTTVHKYGDGRDPSETGYAQYKPGSIRLDTRPLIANKWKTVAVVFDEDSITLYENGEKVKDKTYEENSLPLSDVLGENSVFRIGASNWQGYPDNPNTNQGGERYNGYIDNFQIYDAALTGDQIKNPESIEGIALLADFDFEEAGTTSFTHEFERMVVIEDTAPEEPGVDEGGGENTDTPEPGEGENTGTPEPGEGENTGTPEADEEENIAAQAEEIVTVTVTATATIPADSGELLKTDRALDLHGANKGLYVTNADGAPILKGLETATIVFDSYLQTNKEGNFWPFYAAKDTNIQIYGDTQEYIGMYEGIDKNGASTTTLIPRQIDNTRSKKSDADIDTARAGNASYPITGKWKTVAVVFDKENTYFYVDGELVDKNGTDWKKLQNVATIKDILGETGGIFQIGHGNWGKGEFYNGMLDNFQIYDSALSATEVAALFDSNTQPDSAKKIANFTFDDYEEGFLGAGAVARSFLTHDADNDGDVELYLSDAHKTYLNVLKGETSPLAGKDTITISYKSIEKHIGRYFTEGDGANSNWTFYAAANTNPPVYNSEKYIGITETGNNVLTHVWNNSGNRGNNISQKTFDTDEVRRIDVVIDGTAKTASLYINGGLKQTIEDIPSIKDILGETGGILQIGKANWSSGEYYNGYIDDYKIYDQAVIPQTELKVTNLEYDDSGKQIPIRVLAGHLRETLEVVTEVEGEEYVLGPTDYTVEDYESRIGQQTVKIIYGQCEKEILIDVYNQVDSTQTQVLDSYGNPIYTVSTTWYDYLSDPEREGGGSYDVNNEAITDENNDGIYETSASGYVQFNNAISKYWEESQVNMTTYHPLYWGSFYRTPDAYENSLKGYKDLIATSQSYSLRGLLDNSLTSPENKEEIAEPKMGGTVTPYFGHNTSRLTEDDQGDVYMNVYNNVQMPLVKTTDKDGIDYYEFYCGQKHINEETGTHEETGTFQITSDEENTVIWYEDNQCKDNEGTYSFLPFDTPNDGSKDIQNNGFAMRMEIPFYNTYDGCLEADDGHREPMVFEFNGDDDFFLFIDGYLVLDIGGVHGAKNGKIDFAKGTISLDNSVSVDRDEPAAPYEDNLASIAPELDLTDPSQRHTIVIYYMERGMYKSSLKLRFNLPQENSLAVTKKVDTSDVNKYFTTPSSPDANVTKASSVFKDVIAKETFEVEVKSDYKTAVQGPITSKNWAMYTIIIEDGGANGKNYISSYINGVKIGKVETSISLEEICAETSEATPVKAFIGYSQYNDPLFKGSIRDLAIYNTVLSAEEVVDLYRGHSIDDKPLIAYDFSTITSAANGTVIQNSGSLGAGESYDATIKGNGATVTGSILALPGGSYENGDAYVELPDDIPDKIPNGKSVLTINCLLKNEMDPGDYMALFMGRDANSYWFLNPKNKNGHMKTVVSVRRWEGEEGIIDKHGEVVPVDGENILYHNGTSYAPGTISNGLLSLKDGESMVLQKRDPKANEEVGFLTVTGTSFSIEEVNVDDTKYDTSWKLTDTMGNLIGSSNPNDIEVKEEYKVPINKYIIDDNNSEYQCNETEDKYAEGRFALLNKDGTITPDSHSALVRINLTADFINKVKVGDIKITKQLVGSNIDADAEFKFTLKLSDLFGTETEDVLYQGTYYVGTEERTTTDGVIRIKAGEVAVIKGIPVKTTYSVTELESDGYFHLGEDVQTGVVVKNETETDNLVTMRNILTNGNEFYVWKDHETELPINNFYSLYDHSVAGGVAYKFATENYEAVVKNDGKVYITGHVHGNVVVAYYAKGDTNTIRYALVHIYEPDNKAYVLDYGLPVELNADPDSFGISYDKTTDLYSVTGQYLKISYVDSVTQFKGFKRFEKFENKPVTDIDWSNFVDSVKTEAGSLTWKKASETDSAESLVYEPTTFMDAPDRYEYRVDVTKEEIVDEKIKIINMDDSGMTAADGARMLGELTIVPASVVYYEDNFEAIELNGEATVIGTAEDLWQSNDQKGVYGYDDAYAVVPEADVEAMDEDLILHYDFKDVELVKDENGVVTGATIPDVSGKTTGDATLVVGSDAKLLPVFTNGAMSLSGGLNSTGSYIKLPTGLTNDKEAITISAWLSSDEAVFKRAALFIGNGTSNYWLLNPRTDVGAMRSVIRFDGEDEINAASEAGKVTDADWALYTTVIENGKITLYCNGSKVATAENEKIVLADLGSDLNAYIGYSDYVKSNGDFLFDGSIRDLRIYDCALNESQVKALYKQQYDSAGSSTRLEVSPDGLNDGTMTFEFKGTGFDIIGRTTSETAGMMVKVIGTATTNGKVNVKKAAVVDTVYYNGELYQLPVISMQDLPYDTYKVEVSVFQTQHDDQYAENTAVYVDAVRIYNPLGNDSATRDKYYLAKENNASVYEVRELILGDVNFEDSDESMDNTTSEDNDGSTLTSSSKISLVSYEDENGVSVHGNGKSYTEDIGKVTVKETSSFKDILEKGPNNEVYLGYGNAIAFCVKPEAGSRAANRTVQIEAKKAAGEEDLPEAEDLKEAAEENNATVLKVLSHNSNPQVIDINTYTSMYYEIDLSKCLELPNGSRLVVLASTGGDMVSLTKIKVNGYEISAYNPTESYDTLSLRTISALMLGAYVEPTIVDDSLPFTDTESGAWYETSVSYVYANDIMTGLNKTTFAPYNTLTRAEFAVVLYRMEGQPEVIAESPFGDITGEEWFGKAVLWAQKNGIVAGYQNGNFGPYDYITREQMAVIMHKYSAYKGYDITASSDISKYKDAASITAFAETAMKWAVGNEIINGKDNQTLLDPLGETTRAECAVIVHRFFISLED